MERDFLGLRTVNDDSSPACAESVTNRGSGMQWSFSNKGSTQSPYMSFRASHEEKLPSGFMTISTLDSLDVNQKSQRRGTPDNVVTAHSQQYQSAAYPLHQFNAHSATRSQEMRMFPSMNQPSQIFTTQNQVSPNIHLGAVRVMPPVSFLPNNSSLVGSTDIRAANKPVEAPAQLTIFYAGAVCVYDDVSPEKAKAIMLLAGNGSSANHHKTVTATEVQTQIRSPTIVDESNGSRSYPQQFMGVQANNAASRGSMHGNLELHAVKSAGSFESAVRQQQQECSKVISSAGTSSTSMFPPPAVALPQFRKASLARFLEKRKERVTSSSPYSLSRLPPDSNGKRIEYLNLCSNTASS